MDELPTAGRVRAITFVPFLPDGRCVLAERPDGSLVLPHGEVLPGEDYARDTVLRVPSETAGFRYQRFGPFRLDGDHLYAWIEGTPYTGTRPHARVPLRFCRTEKAAGWPVTWYSRRRPRTWAAGRGVLRGQRAEP